ncbi:MAG: hypothetical protein ACI8Y7_000787 [Candidatus Woesearchaeota archaeon]|jgi:hypothetical protein
MISLIPPFMTTFKVADGHYKKTTFPHALYSGGVGPCLVVGALHLQDAYMLHNSAPTEIVLEPLEKMLLNLRQDVKKGENLSLYVIGREPVYELELIADAKVDQASILHMICQQGFGGNIKKVEWCKQGQCQSLYLSTLTKKATIETDPAQEQTEWYDEEDPFE